ncbi:MAG: sigma-E factor negative regulatory protein, partial [Pseudomonadota bacterium]|nr:sigma-E factor negative regulatory protein [Pseudomonadota bacterium]
MTTGYVTDGLATDAGLLERLSALADGELDGAAAAATCAAWRLEAAACASWHTYHLIGDVLRSHDLAAHPARDAAFLGALRGRLAKEPVIIAPRQPSLRHIAGIETTAGRAAGWARRRWNAPAAVAACFAAVAVATVLIVTRTVEPGAPVAATIARADAPAAAQGG